jgi:type IV secretory pathway TraG/TraD family ATPase VirD4
LIEEVIAHIPEDRKKDVIIFDPTDEKFPFCFNPLDMK